ncbi:phage tail tube protein [Pseudomonas schmalbachii]|uniref:Phage tail tube protein n=1 Tax=Pseudomonas schmalbachii TaxID=2816993 RepID=A0ABS3TKD7_9PSED|nr:phage tail tube protein [Pseudomonas schmalbachii]MBO3274129.1 phage tail tube protein [Pseudomonas schmalbachii]
MARVGGIISLKIDGESYDAKGNFSYNLGANKKEMVVGADGIHGYKELPQVPYIEGEITDSAEISMEKIRNVTNATVTLQLANGKLIALRNAVEASDGTGNTEEGNQTVRFEGMSAEEIR